MAASTDQPTTAHTGRGRDYRERPTTINTGGLQTCLFYQMDLKRDATASVTLGSLQDNGSAQTTGIPLWTSRTGGDGFDVVFDHVSCE